MRISLLILFFGSGALALIYEVIWQREFALIFGSSAPASAVVLAAYFIGLSAGSIFLGNRASRWRCPLRAYAWLEAGAGLSALAVTPIIAGGDALLAFVSGRITDDSPGLLLVKGVVALLAILVPTFCMGATLPVLGRLAVVDRQRTGLHLSLLYLINTAGAACGALLVPFILLPTLGMSGTVMFSVACNLLIAGVAWWMGREDPTPEPKTKPPLQPPTTNPVRFTPGIPLAFVSGLAVFALQVLWNRAFAQVHENSIYSFAVIAAVFILALAAGGQAARWGLKWRNAPERLIGWAWIGGGTLIVLCPWLFVRLTDGLVYLPQGGGWIDYGWNLTRLALLVLLIPVALLGIAFPAMLESVANAGPSTAVSRIVGRLLGANLLGAVAGALVAGFWLSSWLGVWRSMQWIGLGLSLAGIWQLGRASSGHFPARVPLTRVLAVAASLVFMLRVDLPRVHVHTDLGERVLSIREGMHGVVAVVESPDSRQLKLNNHYMLGGSASAGDERMQCHVPLVLHPRPRRVALLGLGTGITASGALFHPVQEIVVVELVPEVLSAAREFFSEANARVLTDGRTRVVTEDARNYLRRTRARFDVIVGDLVVPWRQGESALFTLEHFTAARAALAPGGLFCQWLPMFQLSESDWDIILHTFAAVFPEISVWRADFSPTEPAVALIGRAGPGDFSGVAVEARLREMRPDPENPHLSDPVAFWMYCVGELSPDHRPGTARRINHEQRPWIELNGPLEHAGLSAADLCTGRRLQRVLASIVSGETPSTLPHDPAMRTGRQAGRVLYEHSLSLLEENAEGARSTRAQLSVLLGGETHRILFPQ